MNTNSLPETLEKIVAVLGFVSKNNSYLLQKSPFILLLEGDADKTSELFYYLEY